MWKPIRVNILETVLIKVKLNFFHVADVEISIQARASPCLSTAPATTPPAHDAVASRPVHPRGQRPRLLAHQHRLRRPDAVQQEHQRCAVQPERVWGRDLDANSWGFIDDGQQTLVCIHFVGLVLSLLLFSHPRRRRRSLRKAGLCSRIIARNALRLVAEP